MRSEAPTETTTTIKPSGKGLQGTHDRILAAALQLFSEKGFRGASTREIARAADLSEVTLFRHFPTKEQLLEEVINCYSVSGVQDLIPEIISLPYEEGLHRLAGQLLTTLDNLRDWLRILHQELLQSPDKLPKSSDKLHQIYNAFLDTLFASYATYFRALQEQGALREFDPELGARAFHGLFFSFFNLEEILQRKNCRQIDNHRTITEFVRIFAHGTEKSRASPGSQPVTPMKKGGLDSVTTVCKGIEGEIHERRFT